MRILLARLVDRIREELREEAEIDDMGEAYVDIDDEPEPPFVPLTEEQTRELHESLSTSRSRILELERENNMLRIERRNWEVKKEVLDGAESALAWAILEAGRVGLPLQTARERLLEAMKK